MNTIEFHVILTASGNRTIWTHATRDLALARITALLVRDPTLKVTEHPKARVQFTPSERTEHVHFEVTPASPHGLSPIVTVNLDEPPPGTKLGEIVQPHVAQAFATMTERANIAGFTVAAPPPADFNGGDREVAKPEQLSDFVRELNAAAEAWINHYRGDKEGHPHGAFIDGYMHSLGWRLDPHGQYVLEATPHPRAGTNAPPSLIGSPGWRKGVLDCIDVLVAHQKNTHGFAHVLTEMTAEERGARTGMLDAVIAMLQALYRRDAGV